LPKLDNQKLKESLLLAIYMGHTGISEFILKLPQYKALSEKKFLNSATDSFWQTPSSDDAQFSPDITPIMLASQYNRTEIVQMLLSNGDRIEKPHEFYCTCNECSNRFKFDSLRHAQSRLNAYRGIASESYISLASIDPILTAFELGHELQFLADKEKYFKSEYSKLSENLSEYVVKLLNNVRGRDELEILLNKTGDENEEKYDLLARLDMAIKYREMPVSIIFFIVFLMANKFYLKSVCCTSKLSTKVRRNLVYWY
jgi:transient receptor potential cation channel subfamily C member 6